MPHQKLLGGGFVTPMPLFCLICTINPNKTGNLDFYQNIQTMHAHLAEKCERMRIESQMRELKARIDYLAGNERLDFGGK